MGEDKFKYTVDPELDEVVDEMGKSVIMLRKLAWGERNPKVEIRKWIIDVGKETANKGVTFLTDEGPHNLTHILIRKGFGNTEKVLRELKEREDFNESLSKVIGKQTIKKAEETQTEFFDPREVLR